MTYDPNRNTHPKTKDGRTHPWRRPEPTAAQKEADELRRTAIVPHHARQGVRA